MARFCDTLYIVTDRVSREGKAIGSVRSSVCLSVRPFVSTLSYKQTADLWTLSLCVCVERGGGLHDHSSHEIEGQGQHIQRVW